VLILLHLEHFQLDAFVHHGKRVVNAGGHVAVDEEQADRDEDDGEPLVLLRLGSWWGVRTA
jgi:hypothetical protein